MPWASRTPIARTMERAIARTPSLTPTELEEINAPLYDLARWKRKETWMRWKVVRAPVLEFILARALTLLPGSMARPRHDSRCGRHLHHGIQQADHHVHSTCGRLDAHVCRIATHLGTCRCQQVLVVARASTAGSFPWRYSSSCPSHLCVTADSAAASSHRTAVRAWYYRYCLRSRLGLGCRLWHYMLRDPPGGDRKLLVSGALHEPL